MLRYAPRPRLVAALTGAACAALACQSPSGPDGSSPIAVSADSAVAATGRPAEPGARAVTSSNTLVDALKASECQPLPAVRPADWSVRFERATRPLHGPHTRESMTLATSCAAHGKICEAVTPADLDALYATFQRLGFSGDWEVNPGDYRSHHYGSRELSARWGQTVCRVHDGRGTWVARAHEGDFRALIDAFFAALDRAKGAGKPAP